MKLLLLYQLWRLILIEMNYVSVIFCIKKPFQRNLKRLEKVLPFIGVTYHTVALEYNMLPIANVILFLIYTKKIKNGTSKFLGVFLKKENKKLVSGNIKEYYYWVATIRKNNKVFNLGRFKNEIEAAMAYDEAAKIHHKKFLLI